MKKLWVCLAAGIFALSIIGCVGDVSNDTSSVNNSTNADLSTVTELDFVAGTDVRKMGLDGNIFSCAYLPAKGESSLSFHIKNGNNKYGADVALDTETSLKNNAEITIPVKEDCFYKISIDKTTSKITVTESDSLTVTTTFYVQGEDLKTGDLIWFNGSPWGNWGNGWPFSSWSSDTKAQEAIENMDACARYVGADGVTEPINADQTYKANATAVMNFKYVQCLNLDSTAIDEETGLEIVGWLPGLGGSYGNGNQNFICDGTFTHISFWVSMDNGAFSIVKQESDYGPGPVAQSLVESDEEKETLEGKITAVITSSSVKYKNDQEIVLSASDSKFQNVKGSAKEYEWSVAYIGDDDCNETLAAGTDYTVSEDNLKLTLGKKDFGQYQVALTVKQSKGSTSITSIKTKKAIVVYEDDEVVVRIRVKVLDEGQDTLYLAHTGGYTFETGNPVHLTTGDDWAPFATNLTEKDSSGNFLYRDSEGYFYRDYFVPAAENFQIQPTRGSWGSKARCGKEYNSYEYVIKPSHGTETNPSVITITEVDGATKGHREFHWGRNANNGDTTPQNVERPALLVFGDDTQSVKIIGNRNDGSLPKILWGRVNTDGEYATVTNGTVEGESSGYEAVLSGLEAGKKYFYKVGTGKKTYFQAPAKKGNDFTFGIIADHQTENELSKLGFNRVAEHKPDFVVSCGDITNEGYSVKEWTNRFFSMLPEAFAGIPFAAAPGNHDDVLGGLFADYLGQKEAYRKFEYGGVSFYTLNVESSYYVGTAQYNWFEESLKNDKNPLKIVILHESPYCAGPRHYSNILVRRELEPLFKKYGVDFVAAGHQHIMNVTKLVDKIQYATLPCLGAGLANGDVKTDETFEDQTILGKYGYSIAKVSVDKSGKITCKIDIYGYETATEEPTVIRTLEITDTNTTSGDEPYVWAEDERENTVPEPEATVKVYSKKVIPGAGSFTVLEGEFTEIPEELETATLYTDEAMQNEWNWKSKVSALYFTDTLVSESGAKWNVKLCGDPLATSSDTAEMKLITSKKAYYIIESYDPDTMNCYGGGITDEEATDGEYSCNLKYKVFKDDGSEDYRINALGDKIIADVGTYAHPGKGRGETVGAVGLYKGKTYIVYLEDNGDGTYNQVIAEFTKE